MTTRTVTVIPGDGIGPEVVSAALRVVDALGLPILWERRLAGLSAESAEGSLLPQGTIDSIVRNRVAVKGPTATPVGGGHRSVNVELRKRLDLFANIRPVHTMPGITTLFSSVDVVVVRENVEDLYIGEERFLDEGHTAAEAISRITLAGSRRIAKCAFEYCRRNGRRKVTVVHKGNILKFTHGLFLSAAEEVARAYPEIECDNLIADNFMMQLVRNPKRFDCLLLPNFLGDLVSDLCAGLVGGLGFAPGANIGDDCAVFEAVHGIAADIAGKGIANPTAMILSLVLMLEHLGEPKVAARVKIAVMSALSEGVSVTADVNPVRHVSTEAFADAVIAKL